MYIKTRKFEKFNEKTAASEQLALIFKKKKKSEMRGIFSQSFELPCTDGVFDQESHPRLRCMTLRVPLVLKKVVCVPCLLR